MSFIKTKEEIQQAKNAKFKFFGAELAFVFWLTKEKIVNKLLPPPLEPFNQPLVAAYIANFPKISFGKPYKEGAIFLAAQYNGVPGLYCLAMPVTEDIAMAGGREFYGFSKKIADIDMNKEGTTIKGGIKRHGIEFFNLEIDLTADSNDESAGDTILSLFSNPAGTPYYNFIHGYHPGTANIMKPVNLVEYYFRRENQQVFDYGSGKVTLNRSIHDPWFEIEIEKLLGCTYIVQDTIMENGQILTEIDPEIYAPYAYKMWDTLPKD